MRRFLLSAALFAMLPGHAPAQERFGWLDLISPDRIAQQMMQTGILALRTQMDLKYGDMSVDILTGKLTLTDVRMWPLPPWDVAGNCEVNIGRMTLRSNPLDRIERLRMKAQLTGVTAPLDCLPPDMRDAVGMARIETLDIPRLTLDVDYGIPGSDAVVRMFAVVENAAAIDLSADFAYVWVDARQNPEMPLPVVFLKNARLTLEDRGAFNALRSQLPPPFVDAQAAAGLVEGMIGGVIADLNRRNAGSDPSGDPSALNDSQNAFLASVVSSWSAFLNDPETLVLETALTTDTYLDLVNMERNPKLIFDILQPRLALASTKVAGYLPVSLLQQATGSEAASLSDDEARRVGLALITGIGAPRDIDSGFALLSPLAEAGDGAAALALSEALENRTPEEGYHWALIAGRAGEAGATARLDRLERVLDFARVLQIQDTVAGDDFASMETMRSVSAVREQAAMRASGRGLTRSYAAAATWAILGKALGDAESADILADLDENMRLAGPTAQTIWRPVEQAASDRALEAWLDGDLPARFTR